MRDAAYGHVTRGRRNCGMKMLLDISSCSSIVSVQSFKVNLYSECESESVGAGVKFTHVCIGAPGLTFGIGGLI